MTVTPPDGAIQTQKTEPANEEDAQSVPSEIPSKADFSGMRQMNVMEVKRVIDPLRIELADGTIIQLAALDIPDMHAHEPGNLTITAQAMLQDFLAGKQVRIHQTRDAQNGRVNRMGYALAHLERADNDIWVQGFLLVNGLARVFPADRNTEMAAAMMKLEDIARQAGRGLWADEQYRLLDADDAGPGVHGLAVVEGTIKNASMVNNRIYLNFGDDWRTDFTIGIEPAVRRRFIQMGIDPLSLAHKQVRVRGWLEDYNGPYIRLSDPAWLEILP